MSDKIGISYNEEISLIPRRKEDAQAVMLFGESKDKSDINMVLTYNTASECRRRRATLNDLINNHPEWELYIVARQNKLFIVREQK